MALPEQRIAVLEQQLAALEPDTPRFTEADFQRLIGGMMAGGHTAQLLLRQGIFVVDVYDALPTADATWRGQFAVVHGDGATTNDRLYMCRLLSSGSYEWTAIL
jgi:hypothetical protein